MFDDVQDYAFTGKLSCPQTPPAPTSIIRYLCTLVHNAIQLRTPTPVFIYVQQTTTLLFLYHV